MLLFQDTLLPLRTWIYSRVKKVDPRILQSIWNRCKFPKTVLISEYAEIGENVVFQRSVEIRGQSTVGKNTVIDSNTVIAGSIIGAGCHIHPNTIIAQSTIGDNCELGPQAFIELSRIGDYSRIGFTAQVKRSILGDHTSAKHHCYIGDTRAEKEVNFGAGSITGNYSGMSKFETEIGHGAFIGINVNLIAPVTIGHDAFIAAGSKVSENVPPHTLVLQVSNLHTSTGTFSQKTSRGYERLKIGTERLKELRDFFGDELGEWFITPATAFGNQMPIDFVEKKEWDAFDSAFERVKNSCCT